MCFTYADVPALPLLGIEAREGAKFQFHGRRGPQGAAQFQARYFTDGVRAASWAYLKEQDRNFVCGGFDLDDGIHSFFFGPMDKTSEEASKEEQSKLAELFGTLEVQIRPCTFELNKMPGKGTGERSTAKVFEDSKLAKLGISVRLVLHHCPLCRLAEPFIIQAHRKSSALVIAIRAIDTPIYQGVKLW